MIFLMVFSSLFPSPRYVAQAAPVSAPSAAPAGAVDTAGLNTLTALLSLPICPTVVSTNPFNPAFLHPGEQVTLQWQGEPANIASRRVFIFNVTLPEWGG